MRHLIFISLCSLLWTACGNTDNDFDASGTFEATEILVSSEANGKIMELNIEEGDRLDAGAIVGYVDSTQLFLRKMQLSASLRSVDIRKPDIRKQIAVLEARHRRRGRPKSRSCRPAIWGACSPVRGFSCACRRGPRRNSPI